MLKTVGRSILRPDAEAKVTGRAKYAGDISLPDMLHMKILLADRPHALIKTLDAGKARKMPGVAAVLTARDVPRNRYGLISADQPVLCDQKVLFEGDHLAAVIADTPGQAARAAEQIRVSYQTLPVLDSPDAAVLSDAIQLHPGCPENRAGSIQLAKGDLDAGFRGAAQVLKKEYRTPMQEHAFLEPEAGLAYVDPQDRIVVLAAGQCVHDDQRQIAEALAVDPDRIRVLYGTVGGAFGGREDVSVQILLALAVQKTGRPVHIVWSRRESILGHPKRHAAFIQHKWGADQQGKILAADVVVQLDAGAYLSTSSSVLEVFLSQCLGPYEVPHVRLRGEAVYTNNPPGGAFRGYGAPQAAFAAELHISRLAEKLGLDPITMRMKNYLTAGSALPTGTVLKNDPNLEEMTRTCALQGGWQESAGRWQPPAGEQAGRLRRGYGIAAGMKAIGYGYGYPEGSEAKVALYGGASPEHAEVYTAAVDVGQGSRTVLGQIAAEVLQLPADRIRVIDADTAAGGVAGATAASRVTLIAGRAVQEAAQSALEEWRNENRPAVGKSHWKAPPTTAPDPQTGACQDNLTYSYGVQGVEVEVDLETGQVDVIRVDAIHDPGRAVNPRLVEGQIEGAVVQGLGWALLENFLVKNGVVMTDSLTTYLLPTARDRPADIEITLLETPDPLGPYGIRGVGEIPLIPLAPAVAAAVQNAVGVWFSSLPITPEILYTALQVDGSTENVIN